MSDFEAALDAPLADQVVHGLTLVSGWAVFGAAPTKRVSVTVANHDVGTLATGRARPDVGSLFDHRWATTSGFAGVVDLAGLPPGPAQLSIVVTDAVGRERRLNRAVTIDVEPQLVAPGADEFDSMLLAWLNQPLETAGPPWLTRGALQLRLALGCESQLPDDAQSGPGFLLWLFNHRQEQGAGAVPDALLEGIWREPAAREHHSLPARWRETGWGRRVLCWLNDDAGVAAADLQPLSRFGYIVLDLSEGVNARYPDPFAADRASLSAWVSTTVGDPATNPHCLVPRGSAVAADWRPQVAPAREDERAPLYQAYGFPRGHTIADARGASARPRLPTGVNVVGHFREPSGLTEASRATTRALRRAGFPLSILETGPVDDRHDADVDRWRALEHGYAYDVSVLHDNLAHAPTLLRRLGLRYLLERRIVGYWYWELGDAPKAYDAALHYVDEIWTASTFTAEALQARAPVPVTVVPPVLDIDGLNAGMHEHHASVPRERFVFLAMASVHSGVARKNPRGVVEAFERAFGGDALQRVALVLKITGLELVPDLAAFIADAARRLPLNVITDSMTHARTLGLIASSDAFVSLHRGEGFGLPLAEAMALGRPVIATAYAGNMDFTTEDSAFLVDYDLVPLDEDEGPYRAGQMWAEPRIDRAAERMREVVTDKTRCRAVAQKGRELVLERYDGRRTAEIVAARLRADG